MSNRTIRTPSILRTILRGLVACAVALLVSDLASARGQVLRGPRDPNGPGGPCHNAAGDDPNAQGDADPIDFARGEFLESRTDVFLASRGMPLELTFLYRSQSAYNGPFGYGWDLSYHRRIRLVENASDPLHPTVALVSASGRVIEFAYDAASGGYGGTCAGPCEVHSTLNVGPGYSWYRLRHRQGMQEHFDQAGNLIGIEDRNGNAITFAYEPGGPHAVLGPSAFFVEQTTGVVSRADRIHAITDTIGRSVTFSYTAEGRLASLEYLGRQVRYAYSASGDLVSVTRPATQQFPDGTTTAYEYEAHNLSAITDARQQRYLQNYYDGTDRVYLQVFGGSWSYSIMTYGVDPLTERVVLAEVRDRNGNESRYHFDAQGHVVRHEQLDHGAIAFTTTHEYDAAGERTRTVLPRGNALEYLRDASSGDLLEVRQKPVGATPHVPGPGDVVTRFTYEPTWHFAASVTDPLGRTSSVVYDANGNALQALAPAVGGVQPTTTFAYDAHGDVIGITEPDGTATVVVRDGSTGRPTEVVAASGTALAATTQLAWDAAGRVSAVTDPNGATTRFDYDEHDQLVRVTAPQPFGYRTHYRYDANGNLTRVDRQSTAATPPALPDLGSVSATDGWQSTMLTYDFLDQLATVTDDVGQASVFGYDGSGNVVYASDALGRTTQFVYDARDLLTRTLDTANLATEYELDANGNVVALRDPGGNRTQFTLDGLDRLVRTTYADGSFESATYDAASQITSVTTAAGQTIAYQYDALGRTTVKTTPSETTTFTWDVVGRLVSAVDDDAALAFAWDALGRVTSATTQFSGDPQPRAVSYGYDRAGRRTSMRYPDGSVLAYACDALDRVTAIGRPKAGGLTASHAGASSAGLDALVSYSYDALDRRTHVARSNRVTTDFTYDAVSRVTEILHRDPAGVLERLSYTYDAAGRVLTRGDADGTRSYAYDARSQLVSDAPGVAGIPIDRWSYDAAGNRTTSTEDGRTSGYSANALNQYARIDSLVQGYDPNGNLVSDGAQALTYDAESRLTQASGAFGSASYAYDALGRRIRRTINGVATRFVYDGPSILEELGAGPTPPTRYVHGTQIDEPLAMERGGVRSHYVADALGSIRRLANDQGTTVERYRYSAFGRTSILAPHGTPLAESAFGNRYTFTARELEPQTGLLHLRARELSPSTGKFLQRDPLGFGPDTSLQRYVGNNPLSWIDPFGLSKRGWLEKLGDFAAGMGDAISLGLTSKVRQLFGTDDLVNRNSGFYTAGSVAGEAWWMINPTSAGSFVGTRGMRSLTNLVHDGRSFSSIRKALNAGGGFGGTSIHHLFVPQRLQGTFGGLVNGRLNMLRMPHMPQWMNTGLGSRSGFQGHIDAWTTSASLWKRFVGNSTLWSMRVAPFANAGTAWNRGWQGGEALESTWAGDDCD